MPKHVDPGHPCPCTSGQSFGACCRPYLRAEREPPDAVSQMRSRFTAFALEHAEHLFRTIAPGHPDRARPPAEVMKDLRRACRTFEYRALQILDHKEADAAGRSLVLFHAHLGDRGRDRSFVELSDFVHDGVGFRYLSGQLRDGADLKAGDPPLTLATFTPSVHSAHEEHAAPEVGAAQHGRPPRPKDGWR